MEQGEQAARGILINLLADKLKTSRGPEREQIIKDLLVSTDIERLTDLYTKYQVEPERFRAASSTTKLMLLLDGDLTTTTSPDRITAVLEANSDVETIQLIDCSAQQLLDFVMEVQEYALDQHMYKCND